MSVNTDRDGIRMPKKTSDDRRRIDLLWGTGPRPGRGPRPGLSLNRIAHTALAIADAEGLDAVSMQRVAAELGYTTMSLYRYVPGKDSLIEVMLDIGVGTPPAPTDADWRTEVETWVRALWQVYLEHPWATRVQIHTPPAGPGQLAWFEAALRPLARAGLTGGELVAAVLFLLGSVRQLARISVDMLESRQRAGLSTAQAEASYQATLREFVDRERFPTLATLVDDGTFEPTGLPDGGVGIDLEFGVRRLLDGIAAYVRRAR